MASLTGMDLASRSGPVAKKWVSKAAKAAVKAVKSKADEPAKKRHEIMYDNPRSKERRSNG